MGSQYTFRLENLYEIYPELEWVCRAHYAEMKERLLKDGIEVAPYNPRLDRYFKASVDGWLKTFVVRHDGKICGYSNVYVTNDMHNGEFIAQEDVLFIVPEHRNGIGRKLVQFVLRDLECLGVKRVSVSALTDLRVAKLWARMGFKEVATQMVYTF